MPDTTHRQGRFTSPDEFTGGPDELYGFVDAASENPTFYADLTNPQSLNKYQYTYNNPLRYTDPSGHCPAGVGVLCVVAPVVITIPGLPAVVAGGAAAGATAIGAYLFSKLPGDGHLTGDGSCMSCDRYNYNYQQRAQKQEQQNILSKNNSGDQNNQGNSNQQPSASNEGESTQRTPHGEQRKQEGRDNRNRQWGTQTEPFEMVGSSGILIPGMMFTSGVIGLLSLTLIRVST